jgi:hypothetical protein
MSVSATRQSLARGQSAGFGLPHELLARARERLHALLLLTLFGSVLSLAVRLSRAIAGDFARERIGLLYVGTVSLMAAGSVGLLRIKRESPVFALRLGLVFEVFLGWMITVGHTAQEVVKYGHVPYLTWTAPFMIAFPIIVPSPPRLTLITAAVTGSSSLAAVFLVSSLGMVHATLSTYVEVSVSPIIAITFAYFGSQIVHGLNVDYAKAMRMGSYELKTKLGSGGMGEVWRAEHQLLARPAAVKVIRKESLEGLPLDGQSLLDRFQREAQATAMLRSPHTVELYDFGIAEDGSFFYVMELLDGLDLDELVVKYGPMPPERAVHVLGQVCASLAEAHENQLIHRDVKPANVYLCQYGLISDFAKVLDFGLVKAQHAVPEGVLDASVTAANTIRGTPAFIAPEQITSSRPLGPTADVYSLGCVAYWLLTGELLFPAETALTMMLQHLEAPPPRPSACARAPVPAALDDLVVACLAKNPDERPASMHVLAERLAAIAFERPWSQERARDWWAANVPEVAIRRVSHLARRGTAITTEYVRNRQIRNGARGGGHPRKP